MAPRRRPRQAPLELVPDRSCGACTVCCVALTIEDPKLTKMQGVPCPNLAADGGCGIYLARPDTCRGFHCGWRQLRWVPATLRPDLSAVLVRLRARDDANGPALGVVFTLLEARALQAEGLAEAVASAVANDVPAFIHIPGPPGHTSSETPINAALREAVRARDKPRLLDILRQAREHGLQIKPVPLDEYERQKEVRP